MFAMQAVLAVHAVLTVLAMLAVLAVNATLILLAVHAMLALLAPMPGSLHNPQPPSQDLDCAGTRRVR